MNEWMDGWIDKSFLRNRAETQEVQSREGLEADLRICKSLHVIKIAF